MRSIHKMNSSNLFISVLVYLCIHEKEKKSGVRRRKEAFVSNWRVKGKSTKRGQEGRWDWKQFYLLVLRQKKIYENQKMCIIERSRKEIWNKEKRRKEKEREKTEMTDRANQMVAERSVLKV